MTKLREVHVGDEAVLSCEIKHPVPAPQRTWSKGNGQMPDKSRVTETDDGKLIIQRSQESDSGNYTCFTKNVAGGMSRTGKLIVYSTSIVCYILVLIESCTHLFDICGQFSEILW